jgi:hypothetical protein
MVWHGDDTPLRAVTDEVGTAGSVDVAVSQPAAAIRLIKR